MTAARGEAPSDATPAFAARARMLRAASALAGPLLIFASVLFAMRGFAFTNSLTNQHPDILSFWLPRSCLLGRSLAAGHVPLWNPFEMAGVPFAADPQSGWLYLPSMLTSWALPCGEGLRAFIVLNPLLAGLGLYWFLRKEGLHRVAATVGGLSFSMAIAASFIAVSLPFAGFLAWTPFVLVGASGLCSSRRWPRRLGWAALAAVAWGQVANAHMSHGLAMCTGVVVLYLAARAARDARARADVVAPRTRDRRRVPRVPPAREPVDVGAAARADRQIELARQLRGARRDRGFEHRHRRARSGARDVQRLALLDRDDPRRLHRRGDPARRSYCLPFA